MSSVENIPKMDEKKKGKVGITDTNLLLIITIGVFFVTSEPLFQELVRLTSRSISWIFLLRIQDLS